MTFSSLNLEELRQKADEFAVKRDWIKFHTPRNLLMALVGEVGEVAELFQWRDKVDAGLIGWTEEEKVRVGEELADVLIYLVRMADRCDIDLSKATIDKFRKNELKYPAELVRGSSKKYTDNVRLNYYKLIEAEEEVCTWN